MIANGLGILFLLIFVLGLLVLGSRVRRAAVPRLRPLPGFQAATEAIERTAEQGRATHLSSGPSPLADSTGVSAETLAGLDVMGRLARRSAATGTPLVATTGSALAFPLAENVVRTGFAEVSRLEDVPIFGAPSSATTPLTLEGRAQGVRMLTHGFPFAYAAAAADLSAEGGISNAVLIGNWGREYLLVNEAQQRAGIQTVAGATDPEALAPMILGADYTLIGEEMFAGGAYLDAHPAHLASLLAEDTVRWLLIILIIVGVVLATAGISIPALLGYSQ